MYFQISTILYADFIYFISAVSNFIQFHGKARESTDFYRIKFHQCFSGAFHEVIAFFAAVV